MDETTSSLPKDLSFEVLEKPDQICPNCGSNSLLIFYTVHSVPVHCCLLMSSKTDAVRSRRSELQLGFCRCCGFITNVCFDPQELNYSAEYEETQGFSRCFSTFAKSLAQRLIDKYSLRRKTILEIGCGKGEFLALMCKLGGNRGIGIDPAYVPGRNPAVGDSRLQFIKDFYSERYAHLKADVICCRHTLEHIGPTLEFMKTLRRAISDRSQTLVFFEVPDVMRVLREGAFWDIYYEHCSYFTAGTLARLFRASAFEIDDLYLDYDNQYIIITAYPSASQTSANLDLENDIEPLNRAFKEFIKKCSSQLIYWRSAIQQFSALGQKTVIWGSGSKGVAFLTTLKLMKEIEYVVDINPYKHGKNMPGTGQEIVSPQFLTKYNPQKIIVMNPVYLNEIQRDIDRLGIKADLFVV